MNLSDKSKFSVKVSFLRFGEFVFTEKGVERITKKSKKEETLIYVFPKTTAAIAEL